jgi:topoisomerase-4 subunit B
MVQGYSEDSIRTLDWKEHIRKRPGMYIGKLGDGSAADDGIYVLLKEVIDNSVDEFMMGNGKKIDIHVSDLKISVRDYGRGIPLGKLMDVAARMNTGAKYDSKAFKKSVGLNGVGIKAVNALSTAFSIKSVRDGRIKVIEFSKGDVVTENEELPTEEPNGTTVVFTPDAEIFRTYQYGEDYYSFVNGQHTVQGGTHLAAFREALIKTIRDFYKKEFDASDIRASIVAAISIKVEEPVFESQTKTKLGSRDISPDGMSVRNFVMNFIQKLAKQRAKKVSLHNKKLRDCRLHYNTNHENKDNSSIFITEGDSASGSITKSRDVNTQAVFSLRGKPLNSYGLTKKIVYENEEFNLLQAALNIEEGIDELRYNKVIIATDADVDGMHIRLLLITFFLQFFPELIRRGHLYILQTPLFRVRNKKRTEYCYSEQERDAAVKMLATGVEITRFKGLGEISPDEFKNFIGEQIRLDPVILNKNESIVEMLEFYMGKNTPDRQDFIIENLHVEKDEI